MTTNDISPPGREHGFSLSLERFFIQQTRRELSRATPVIDSIDGLSTFVNEAVDHVRRGKNVDILVIGRSGDGKSAISEQIIQQDRLSEKRPIRRRYFNTSMAVEEARARGIMTSPFGQFTSEEYQKMSQDVIRPKLEATEHASDTEPQLRVLEFPAVEEKRNLGNDALSYSSERASRDALYQRRLIPVVGEKALHRRSRRIREDIWKTEDSEALATVFRKYGIAPDKVDIDPIDMRQRMGTPFAIDRIDADLTEQMLKRQSEIRLSGIDKSLPFIDRHMLLKDGNLEVRVLSDLYRLKARENGFSDEEVFIAVNRLLRRKIPYYGNMRNDPSLRL